MNICFNRSFPIFQVLAILTEMAVPETKLLWPKDPRITDSDDWPSYALRKAKVLSKATGEPVSLLAAHDGHPVKVSGTLEAVDDEYSANGMDCHPRGIQKLIERNA